MHTYGRASKCMSVCALIAALSHVQPVPGYLVTVTYARFVLSVRMSLSCTL